MTTPNRVPLKNPDGRFNMDNDFSLAKSLQPEKPYPEMRMTRRGKIAMGIGGLLAAAAMYHGASGGEAGPIDNGPEPRLSDQEIAQLHGGNTPEVEKAAHQANLEEQQQMQSPTDIQPVNK